MREENVGKAMKRLEQDVYATKGVWDLGKVSCARVREGGELIAGGAGDDYPGPRCGAQIERRTDDELQGRGFAPYGWEERSCGVLLSSRARKGAGG